MLERFQVWLAEFYKVGIDAEIWIDGSFATFKESPQDIDIAFFYNVTDLKKISLDQRIIFNMITSQDVKIRYYCDLNIIGNSFLDERFRWRGTFGFSWDDSPKGIARIYYVTNKETKSEYTRT